MMHRDEVFVAGGQPSTTYVDREDQQVEKNLARAIAMPNQIVSLSGPTKTGKTVLCRKVLSNREYVWIDGGKVKTSEDFWNSVRSELNFPSEISKTKTHETAGEVEASIPFITSVNGSHLYSREQSQTFTVASLEKAIEILTADKIVLVVDDFHYIPTDARTDIMRNVKGAVFNGLKIVLLSVTHRAFDAIKAETELTGRFTTVNLPSWSNADLLRIPELGFGALGVDCPQEIINKFCNESQENPFLMQKFCWELCFDAEVENKAIFKHYKIKDDYDVDKMMVRLAEDAGLPIYQKLSAGPQSRRVREKRPLKTGGQVDIYEALLRGIAETGPKQTIKYDEIKTAISNLLTDMIPQKHEVTSALKQLTKISREIGAESAIDWDEDSREVTVADPYLRFYLRWQVRGRS